MMQWEINGLKQQENYLVKLSRKDHLSPREWHLYRMMTGDVDYSEADAGMEKEIRYGTQ